MLLPLLFQHLLQQPQVEALLPLPDVIQPLLTAHRLLIENLCLRGKPALPVIPLQNIAFSCAHRIQLELLIRWSVEPVRDLLNAVRAFNFHRGLILCHPEQHGDALLGPNHQSAGASRQGQQAAKPQGPFYMFFHKGVHLLFLFRLKTFPKVPALPPVFPPRRIATPHKASLYLPS